MPVLTGIKGWRQVVNIDYKLHKIKLLGSFWICTRGNTLGHHTLKGWGGFVWNKGRHYLKLNLMHKIVHGQAPSYLTSTIVSRQNMHSYNTRLGKTSVFISSGAKLYQSSFQYSASKLWNNIPCDIRNVVSNNTFKRMVKSHLHSIFVNRNESDFIYI